MEALADDMAEQLEQQVARPSWQGLKRLIEQLSVYLRDPDESGDAEGTNFGTYKEPLLELNQDLAKTTSELKALFESKTKGAAQAASESSVDKMSKAQKAFKSIDTATTIIPFALDVLDLIRQMNNDAKQAEGRIQRRTEIEEQLESLKSRAVLESYGAFQSECDELSAVLDELINGTEALRESLDERRALYDSARNEAATLLSSAFGPVENDTAVG